MTAGPSVRPFSASERDLLAAARLVAVEAAPYLAAAMFRVSMVAADIGTFSVDRWWRLYIDPRQLKAWGPQTAAAVLVHEVHHLLRGHAERADDLGITPSTERLSNLAADAEINDDLTDLPGRLRLPAGSVTPDLIGCDEGGLYEDYYHQLLDLAGPDPDAGIERPDGGGEPGGEEDEEDEGEEERDERDGDELLVHPPGDCGSGAGGGPRAWEIGPDAAIVPVVSPSEAQLVRWTVAQELQTYRNGRGDAPGGLLRWADEVLGRATINWRSVLAAALRRAWGWRAGQVDHTYRRPGRRRIEGVVLPAMVAPHPRVAVILDTSASMAADQLRAALAEVEGLARQMGVRRHDLQLICVDVAAARAQPWTSARQIQLVGGGGTDLRVGFDAAARLRVRPDVLLAITDGYTPWPVVAPRAMRTIVLLVPPCSAATTVPGWARTVVVDGGAAPSRRSGGRP